MKAFVISCFLLLLPFASMAQRADPDAAIQRRFYAGVGLSSISYHIYYKEPKTSGYLPSGYFVPFAANFGYRLSDKATLQVGIAYGADKSQDSWFPGGQDTLLYEMASRTRVVAVPVAARVTVFKVYKRFPVYATGTIMPAYGITRLKTIETRGTETTASQERDSGLNVFTTAGLGFNYRLSNRLQGYVEILPFKYNLTGRNSRDLDWEQHASTSRRLYKSLGAGVNCSL